ncbi:MAG: dihydropteroate synthase [Archangium gephyra]|uniref:Dihydropteroate synthase n=1 Tax=Archangium gephyra TaxID=48 RepID=A0A2W5VHL8_9BACT|nr:MAG: dihydropteroate synthase [Archangium gephyra]
MIWARPVHLAVSSALWARLGLGAEIVESLEAGRESYALVTGLGVSEREALAHVVGASWVGGTGDAAVIRYSQHSLEVWRRALGDHLLAGALKRLSIDAPEASLGFEWGARTRVMGIVNVTPDSFSDGGVHATTEAAIAHGRALVKQGADLLDIGGESTRPEADPVSEDEELRRVLPVIEGLRDVGVPLSVDTMKPAVARRAVMAGATLVNDVSGLRDDTMIDVLADTGACACVMHMQGTPRTMQKAPAYEDLTGEILESLENVLQRAERRGVKRSKLWVDPGVGFGKTSDHNLYLLRRAREFRLLGVPVLFGVSRKGFIGKLLGGKPANERAVASATIAGILAADGAVDVVRVHDVGETRDALAVADAIRLARDGGSRFT